MSESEELKIFNEAAKEVGEFYQKRVRHAFALGIILGASVITLVSIIW